MSFYRRRFQTANPQLRTLIVTKPSGELTNWQVSVLRCGPPVNSDSSLGSVARANLARTGDLLVKFGYETDNPWLRKFAKGQ